MQTSRNRNLRSRGVIRHWIAFLSPKAQFFPRGLITVILTLLLGVSSVHAQGLITTVAGSTWAFAPGNTAATTALGAIQGVAVDPSNKVFATDFGNRRVVKIDGATLTVVAGNGTFGSSGDGGPATSAAISLAFGVAADGAGNVYIADTLNHRIRKVSASGTITTVAGTGVAGFSGEGVAASAQLNSPTGVAVDASGNLYIADRDNHRIRKVDPNGTITTIAGNGTAGFADGAATGATLNQPSGVAVSGTDVFIADTLNNRIRKVSAGGTITTVAGTATAGFFGDGGAATSAQLNNPTGVAVSGTDVYIADNFNNRIRKVTGTTINTVAGNGSFSFSGDNGPATSAALASPYSVAVDGSLNVYIADSTNSRVRKVSGAGTITTFAGNGSFKYGGDSLSALSAFMNAPTSVALDGSANLYIADSSNNRIRQVAASTGVITTFAGTGQFGFGGDTGSATFALLNSPTGVAVDRTTNSLYIADVFNNRIRKVDLITGIISTAAGNGLGRFSGDGLSPLNSSVNQPSGVAVDSLGNLYIADTKNQRIRKISGGIILTVAGNGTAGYTLDFPTPISATSASLNNPTGVALDSAGNIYIADRDNHRIRKVTASTGNITTVAGTGTLGSLGDGSAATLALLNFPSGVAVDSAGNIYIADRDNHKIRKVTVATGIISTIAGDGIFGSTGDGGLATFASLGGPQGVMVDASGSLHIADTSNDRIRRIFAGLVSAGSLQGAPGATVNIPVTLGLFGGATVDSLAFGLRVINNGGAPALTTGTLTFTATSPMFAPNSGPVAGASDISVGWLNPTNPPGCLAAPCSPFPLSGAIQLGLVGVTIPSGATGGQSYTIQITGASGSLAGTAVSLLPGTNATLAVGQGSYKVGDSFPPGVDLNANLNTNDAGEFGDDFVLILDLIDALRAVTRVVGFRPLCPSARYDAIDSSPADGVSRGGDGTLDVLDLNVTLKRVGGVDATRPTRTLGGAPACSPTANSLGPQPLGRRAERGMVFTSAASGTLEFGEAEASAGGVRVPVYLQAQEDLALTGLAYAVGVAGSSARLRFLPGQGRGPTLVDDGLPGTLALAWLEGLNVAAGERLLLGFVEVAGLGADQDVTSLLRVYGVVANAQRDGRSINLAAPEVVPVRPGRQLR